MKKISESSLEKINFTVCFLIRSGKVLLGQKQRGIGAGRLNGYGGGVEEGEEILEAAIREVFEETGEGIKIWNSKKAGVVEFSFKDKPGKLLICHIFISNDFDGEAQDTDEMKNHQWFKPEEIPYEQMWSADSKWLPLVIRNRTVKGNFLYDSPEGNRILDYHLEIVKK